MKFQVNKPLVPMKAHYFLWNAGTGPIVPYLSVYARQLGFSSVVVGFIYTILPISGMIAKPLFGAVADRFHCQKIIFLIAQLITAAAFLSIYYSPKVPNQNLVDLSCLGDVTVFQNLEGTSIDSTVLGTIQNKQTTTNCELDCSMSTKTLEVLCVDWQLTEYCDNQQSSDLTHSIAFEAHVPLAETLFFESPTIENGRNITGGTVQFKVANISHADRLFRPVCSTAAIQSTCSIKCTDGDVDTLLQRPEISDAEVYGTRQFWVFLMLMVTAWIGQAISVSIGDTICFEMLGDKPNRYGYQRMYGALGWGLLSLLTGVLVDVMSADKSYTDYSICFYLAASFLVLDFVVSSQLKYTQTKLSTNILKDVGKLLTNMRIVVFIFWCICVGMCTGLVWQFLLWLVEDLAKAQGETRIKTLQGTIMGVQCLGGELPFFFLSGKILNKIGHVRAMSLVLFTIGIRFLLYSYIDNPWYFIPIELSNGLTFGLFYACMASYASIIAPAGTEATMQGMVGAVFEGVGVSLGSFSAGRIMALVSGSLTFRYFGLGSLVACFVHLAVQYLLKAKDASAVVDRKMSFEKVRLDDGRELTSVQPLILR